MSVFNNILSQKLGEEFRKISYDMFNTPIITAAPQFIGNKPIFNFSTIVSKKHRPLVSTFDVYQWMVYGIEPEISLVDNPSHYYDVFNDKYIENYDERLIKPYIIKFDFRRSKLLFIPEYWCEYLSKSVFPKSIIFYIDDRIRLLISDVKELTTAICGDYIFPKEIDVQLLIDNLIDHPKAETIIDEIVFYLDKTSHMISGNRDKVRRFLFPISLKNPDIVDSILTKLNVPDHFNENIWINLRGDPLHRSDFSNMHETISGVKKQILKDTMIPREMLGEVLVVSGRAVTMAKEKQWFFSDIE